MKVAIIGAGVYGAYAASVLVEQCPDATIHMLEVGDSTCQSEAEVGYLSRGSSSYRGLSKGRYFGLGGTSNRWGGQVLTFSACEFSRPTPFLAEIIRLNEQYKGHVAHRLGIPQSGPEIDVGDELHSKEGVWLSYGRRNLFKALGLHRRAALKVRTGSRVIRLATRSNHITSLTIKNGDSVSQEAFDFYVLATGAFESNRLLMVSGLAPTKISFSDHLSRRAFILAGPREFGALGFDFSFGKSCMLTRRLVGEVGEASFFVHPIFNADFAFFQDLKGVLYRRELSRLPSLISGAAPGLRFIVEMLLNKRLYVHGPWYLQVDLEAPPDAGWIELSKEHDRYGERGLDYDFSVPAAVDHTYRAAVEVTRAVLQRNGAKFADVEESTDEGKYEDTYHPFGMFGSASHSLADFYGLFSNLLVANTGILPRAGSINCTAAVFPIIEDYLSNKFARGRVDSWSV